MIVVTSGAIVCGRARLGLNGGSTSLEMQQASAAVGQALLMEHYNVFFGRHGKHTAQILLTEEDFKDETRFGNLLNSLECLLRLGAIPIVNENDTVSTSELDSSEGRDERLFGDNDMLSSLVAAGVKADLLIILSSVDGLLDRSNSVVEEVVKVDENLGLLDSGEVNGRGGLPTKLKAFRNAVESGVAGILANGSKPRILKKIFDGEPTGTFFRKNPEKKENSGAIEIAARAKKTALAKIDTAQRGRALENVARLVEARADEILRENFGDVAEAEKTGISGAYLERLKLTEKKIKALAGTLRSVAALETPPTTLISWKLPNGLKIEKERVSLGVLLLIFESRPDVVVEASALALKSGNAIILKGGKEARRTNRKIVELMKEGIKQAGLPEDAIQLFEGSRQEMAELLKMNRFIDLVVPRGGEDLLKFVKVNSTIPILSAGGGNCHLYVHEAADKQKAIKIALNAKTQKPSACNAIETLLIDEKIAATVLPELAQKLVENGVELRCCPKSQELLGGLNVKPASEADWSTEFLDYILAVKVVSGIQEAVAHINTYGSRHSEAIITESKEAAEFFLEEIDAAVVYWNASTRFTDGGQFGFGAEVCISTQKLHARGPVGLNDLFTYKYVVVGDGQVRE